MKHQHQLHQSRPSNTVKSEEVVVRKPLTDQKENSHIENDHKVTAKNLAFVIGKNYVDRTFSPVLYGKVLGILRLTSLLK